MIHFSFEVELKQQLLQYGFFVRHCCSYSENSLTRGGAVRELWAMWVGTCFTFGGYLFQVCFLAPFFPQQKHIFLKNDSQTDPEIHSKPDLEHIFLHFLESLILNDLAIF